MGKSVNARIFIALRGLLYAIGFIASWAWLAAKVQRLDTHLPITMAEWLRPIGLILASGGAVLVAMCVATFVTRGHGTPAPFDPPVIFVGSGPYKYVRNPMYIGAFSVMIGLGFALLSFSVILLAMIFLIASHAFVVFFEEPAMLRKFGESYAQYRSSVNRWLICKPR